MANKQAQTSNNNNSIKVGKSSLLHWIVSLLPILYPTLIILYIFKSDYALNSNSFSIKSRYMSFFPFIQLQYNATVPCSNAILTENSQNPSCAPKICGRLVSDFLMNKNDANLLSKYAQEVFKGKESLSHTTHDPVNDARQFSHDELKVYTNLKEKIETILKDFFKISNINLLNTYFALLTPIASNNVEYSQDRYQRDKANTSVYTAQIHLSSHYLNMTGGRFEFNDDGTLTSIEPRLGRLIAYTSGSENTYHVERVSNGLLYSLNLNFACENKTS